VKFSRWVERANVRADLLGEHNEEVLKELVGLSTPRSHRFNEEKVWFVIDLAIKARGARLASKWRRLSRGLLQSRPTRKIRLSRTVRMTQQADISV